MHPVQFEGSTEIKKPENMTDEQCYSVWAKSGFGTLKRLIDVSASSGGSALMHVVAGIDTDQYPYYLTAWQPNKEDIEAINRGEPIYVKTLSKGLPPMALFTLDENRQANF
jgi:hypothetical protein